MSDLLENLREQPANLALILNYLHSSGEAQLIGSSEWMRGYKRIAFAGMGGSRYAAQPAALYLRECGIDARVLDASELLYYGAVPPDTALILVSRSGQTAEMVRLSEKMDRAGIPCLAVTNSPQSPMAANARLTLPIAGETDQGVSIRSYTGAVLTLLYLCASAAGRQEQMRTETASMLAQLAIRAREWESEDLGLESSTFFCFLGRGYSLPCAAEAALLFQELPKRPANWYSCAEFRQGPIEVLRPGHSVFVFAPEGPTRALNTALAEEIRRTGAQVNVIGPSWAGLPEYLASISQMIQVQFAAYRLSLQNIGRPGDFQFAAETTKSEAWTIDEPGNAQ